MVRRSLTRWQTIFNGQLREQQLGPEPMLAKRRSEANFLLLCSHSLTEFIETGPRASYANEKPLPSSVRAPSPRNLENPIAIPIATLSRWRTESSDLSLSISTQRWWRKPLSRQPSPAG